MKDIVGQEVVLGLTIQAPKPENGGQVNYIFSSFSKSLDLIFTIWYVDANLCFCFVLVVGFLFSRFILVWPLQTKYSHSLYMERYEWTFCIQWTRSINAQRCYSSSRMGTQVWVESVLIYLSISLPISYSLHSSFDHRDIHNIYGMYMHMSTMQGLINRNKGI